MGLPENCSKGLLVPRRVGANRRQARKKRGKAARAKARQHGRRVALVVVLVAASGALCVGGWLGIQRLERWARSSGYLQVRSIDVKGTCRLGRDEVVKAAGLDLGMALVDVDPAAVREALAKRQWVERVTVRRWLPGKVSLRVTERTPVALVNVGHVYQVDERGVLFDLPAGEYLSLPLLCGLADTVGDDGVRRLAPESYQRFVELRREMDRADHQWFSHIAQVAFTGEHGVWLTIDGYAATVELSGEDLSAQMKQLGRLLEVLAEEEGRTVKNITMSHHNMAYVRR